VFIALRITQSAGASAAQAVGAGSVKNILNDNLGVQGYFTLFTVLFKKILGQSLTYFLQMNEEVPWAFFFLVH